MIWFYVSIACGVAQIVCAIVMYRAYQYTSNRARLAEGKYEALSKLNGDVPRARVAPPAVELCVRCAHEIVGETVCEMCCDKEYLAKYDFLRIENRELKGQIAQMEKALASVSLVEIQQLRYALEEAKRYDIRKYGEQKVIRQQPSEEKVGSYVWSAGGMKGAFCNQCDARGPGQVWLMEHIRDTHLGVT